MLVVCQCSPVKKEKRPPTPWDQYPEKFTKEYISQSAIKLIDFVPDHHFDPSIKSAFSEKYYNLLVQAWDIALKNPENYEENEWLYHFISGNDDMSNADHTKTILEAVVMDDWNTYAKMEYLGMEHDIVMHFENGDWVISNFDGTLDKLEWFVKKYGGQ